MVSRRVRVPGLPRFAVAELHRRVSLIAAVFLALHVLSAVTDRYVSIPLAAAVLPFASAYQPLPVGLGAIAADLGIAVVVTSLLRARIGRRAWRSRALARLRRVPGRAAARLHQRERPPVRARSWPSPAPARWPSPRRSATASPPRAAVQPALAGPFMIAESAVGS